MPKLVEGQLEVLKMVSQFSKVSKSLASSTLRSYVKTVEAQQVNYPDQLPGGIEVKPVVEADTGKIVSSIT